MQAIITVAGEGKRMRPLTLIKPKPMLEVLGKPILHHLIEAMPKEIDEILLVIGYKGEQIRHYFGDHFAGRKIVYVVQEKATGTAMAVHLCKPYLRKGERFMVVYGDDLVGKSDMARLMKHKYAMLVREHENPRRFGVVEVDAKGRIIGLEEKPEQPKSNLIVGPAYIVDHTFFDHPLEQHPNGEFYTTPLINKFIKTREMVIERMDFWHPIGYPHDLESAEAALDMKASQRVKKTSVVIICGGKGTRLPDEERELPKSLVEVAGKPILQHQLELLEKQGVADITLALGYKADMVIDWTRRHGFRNVRYAIEKQLLGTGGAVKFAAKGISRPFIAMSGDVLADFSIGGLLRHADGGHRVMTGVELADVEGMGVLQCDEHKRVCAFKEKQSSGTSGLINAGLYVLYPEDLEKMPDSFSLEYDLFPKLVQEGKLVLHHHKGNYWFDCGTAERLKQVRDYFSNSHI